MSVQTKMKPITVEHTQELHERLKVLQDVGISACHAARQGLEMYLAIKQNDRVKLIDPGREIEKSECHRQPILITQEQDTRLSAVASRKNGMANKSAIIRIALALFLDKHEVGLKALSTKNMAENPRRGLCVNQIPILTHYRRPI